MRKIALIYCLFEFLQFEDDHLQFDWKRENKINRLPSLKFFNWWGIKLVTKWRHHDCHTWIPQRRHLYVILTLIIAWRIIDVIVLPGFVTDRCKMDCNVRFFRFRYLIIHVTRVILFQPFWGVLEDKQNVEVVCW